jgi:hypothetical protein
LRWIDKVIACIEDQDVIDSILAHLREKKQGRPTLSHLVPLSRARSEAYEYMPLGSQVLPFPESPQTDMDKLVAGFRSKRGRVLLWESVSVTSAGGPQPQADWNPNDMSPDLAKSMTEAV